MCKGCTYVAIAKMGPFKRFWYKMFGCKYFDEFDKFWRTES